MLTDRQVQNYLKTYALDDGRWRHQWQELPQTKKVPSLFVQSFAPESYEKTVLVIHGYFDHSATNRLFLFCLLEHGFRVLLFDLPGHGLSGGKRHEVETFSVYQEALHRVIDREDGPLYAMGHSTGGGLLAEYMLNGGQKLERAALAAPLLRSSAWWPSRAGALVMGPFKQTHPRRFRMHIGFPGFMEELAQDPLQGAAVSFTWAKALVQWERYMRNLTPLAGKNVQILQGNKDETIAWTFNMQAYHRLFPEAEKIFIDKGSHALLNEREHLRSIVFHLLLRFLS